jgi:hypothetical protein
MNVVKNIVGFLIGIWDWAEALDPSKLLYNLSWFGGIEVLSVFLYINAPKEAKEETWWHYVLVVFVVPCLVWTVLYVFRIIWKWFMIEYVCVWFPRMRKYLPGPGEK